MRILVLAPGSTGDVAPYTGLGQRLTADGHHVAIAANERFRTMITTAGLEFRLLRGDPESGNTSEEGRRWHADGSGPLGQARMVRVLREYVDTVSEDFIPAVRDGADIVLLNSVALFTGYDVCEGLGVASAGAFPSPVHPTGDLPAAALGLPDLGGTVNRALDRVALAAGALSFGRTAARLRSQLGLAPVRSTSLWSRLAARDWPAFYGYSRALLPRFRDWPRSARVTGAWWPAVPDGWRPDPGLQAFLDAGDPPVFVGLGSRSLPDPDAVQSVIRESLRRAGLRGVVQSGWAGLTGGEKADDRILTIGDVPHEWLFPRMAALVHHCGAGTTAAGLRAGVPTVGLPVLADQPFWASRLVSIGVSPGAVPLRRLTADRLTDALVAATRDTRYRRRAEELKCIVDTEDGAGEVAAVLPSLVGTQ
ncbi:MAG: glycosyltransferase [Pseudonocardia sp.]|nr:glycosyltransferase [Pseudonocardia sp.]